MFHHAEYQEHLSSDGVPTGEWVLMDTAQGSQLGMAQRVQEKEIQGNSLLNLLLVIWGILVKFAKIRISLLNFKVFCNYHH